MYFKVLGALDVSESTKDLTPSAPKLRSTLSLLLLRQGDIVRKDLFVDELWGVDPPPNALTTLQTYVYQLRRTLPDPQTRRAGHRPRGHAWKEATAGPSHGPWLRTTSSGYCASIPRRRSTSAGSRPWPHRAVPRSGRGTCPGPPNCSKRH